MCSVLLLPGDNPIAVNKYNISFSYFHACSTHFIIFYFINLIILREGFYYETPHYRRDPIFLLLMLPLISETTKPKFFLQVTNAIRPIITLFKEISLSLSLMK